MCFCVATYISSVVCQFGVAGMKCVSQNCVTGESGVFCLSALYKALELLVSDWLMIVVSDGSWYEVVKMQIAAFNLVSIAMLCFADNIHQTQNFSHSWHEYSVKMRY
jgi:hypothetical protein